MPELPTPILRELLEKATPGPWSASGHHIDAGETIHDLAYIVCKSRRTKENAALIAALRNHAPAMLDRIATLERENAELRAALEDAERWKKLQKLVLLPSPNKYRITISDYRSPPWCNLNREIDAIPDAAMGSPTDDPKKGHTADD